MTMLDYENDTTTTQEPNKCAHIVTPSSAVTEAYIMGTPVTALCGSTWVPSKDPERLPLCEMCKGIREGLRNNAPS